MEFQDVIRNDGTEPLFRKEFDVGGSCELEVESSGGFISVIGRGDVEHVEIRMFVDSPGHAVVEQVLANYDIAIKRAGSNVSVKARRKTKMIELLETKVSFEILTPCSSSVKLVASGSEISVFNIEGSHRMETSRGDIRLWGVKGETKAETSGGDIAIENCSGAMNLVTSSGEIRIDRSSGKLKLVTSGRKIYLKRFCGAIEAENSGGDMVFEYFVPDNATVMKACGGNVFVSVSRKTSLDLDLRAASIKTAFMKPQANRLKFNVNNGNVPLKIMVSGGEIDFEYYD